ncbi:phage tail tape measure protein [Streptomyces sp. NRAIS4]
MSSLTTRVLYDLVARDNASRTFGKVGASADGLGKKGTALGATLAKGFAVGSAAALGLAAVSVKSAASFQASMTKISTQAGGSAEDVKVLSNQVLALGGKVQQAPKELADALYHLKSVGMDNADAMKALRTASDLAAVGGSDLEATTNALAGAWRTGIKGATSFGQAAATVNSIIGAGNMTMEQFTEALASGILPTAKTFGLSLQQVGAALALFTDEGVPASDAATRLRMSISLLGAPSGAAEKQLKKIGLTGLDLAKAMRGPNGIIGAIQLLKDHLDKSGLSAAQQSQILSRAFGGGKSSSGILSMVSNLDVLKKKQDQVNSSTGRYAGAVAMQRKTAEAEWKRLESGIESTTVRLGTVLLPPVTSFVAYLNDTAEPAAQKFSRKLLGLVPTDKIKGAFKGVSSFVGDFFSGLEGPKKQKAAALPVPMLRAPKVVSPLLPAAPKKSEATKYGESIRQAVTGGLGNVNWGKVGGVVGKGLGVALSKSLSKALDFAAFLGKTIGKTDWLSLGKKVGATALPFTIGFINNLFEPLFSGDFWSKHWPDILLFAVTLIPIGRVAGALGKVFEHIPFARVFSPLLKGIEGLGGFIEKGLGKIFGPIGRGIKDGITKAFPEAVAAFEREAGLFATRVGVWGLRLLDDGAKAARSIGTGIERGVSFVVEKALALGKAVLSPFAKAGGWLLGKGKDIVVGLTRGILDRAAGIASWTWSHVGKPTVDAFKGAGSWLLSKGRSFVSGLKTGIVDGAKAIGSWAWNRIAKPQIDMFKGAASWLVSKGSAFVSGLKNGVVNGAKAIGSWTWSHVGKPTVDTFKNAGSWLWSAGGHLLSGLKNGIVSGIKGIGSWIKKNLIDPVVGAVKHFFGIHSPSTVFAEIGGHMIAGLLKGLAVTSGSDIAKTVFGDLPHALGSIVHKGLVAITKLPGKALNALGKLGGDFLSLLGLGGGGGGSSKNQQIGEMLAKTYGWSGPQWTALRALWTGESGWNERALNKSSGAYGIPQSLPASKMASAGSDWKTNPATQIKWGLSYIKSVYGSPLAAYSKWLSRSPHWYARGTGGAAPGLAWVGERGPELVNFKGGEDVLSHDDSIAYAKTHGIRLPGYASGTINNAADRVRRDKQKVADAKDELSRARRRHKGEAAAEKRLKAAEKELQAAEISLKNAQRNAKTSISNTIKTGLQKTLSSGTASQITSAIKSLATKLLNAGFNWTAGYVQRQGGKLESLANKKAGIEKTIAAANQYASDQSSKISDFLSISGTSAMDVGGLISQLSGQEKTASSFVSLTKSLKARGASKALLQQLSDAGPGSQLATILGARSVTTQDISKLNSLVASGGKLATSFGKDMADLMYDSGRDASKGFLAGLKSQEKALDKQMAKMAGDLVKEIKKILKIKSPSGVFRDEVGRQIALGMVVGMDRHRPHVAAAGRRLAATAYAASAGASSARANAAFTQLAQLINSGQLGGSEVHIHFDDPTLKDLIRVTTKPLIQASASQQAHRAKVGRRTG